MKFAATQMGELASSTKFSAENLEKVFRLRELLIEFHKHSFLRGKLVLKSARSTSFI